MTYYTACVSNPLPSGLFSKKPNAVLKNSIKKYQSSRSGMQLLEEQEELRREKKEKKRTGMEEGEGWRERGRRERNDPMLLTGFAVFTYFQHIIL